MSPRRILYPAGAALSLWLAFTAGRTTAPQNESLYPPTESRADCLEVRLVADEAGDGLKVRAWLWDGDGHVRWTRDLRQEEPLSALWDDSDEGQEEVDLSHWYAEQEVEP